jgi:hypothetical protein
MPIHSQSYQPCSINNTHTVRTEGDPSENGGLCLYIIRQPWKNEGDTRNIVEGRKERI